jgi:hypothetical protein
MRTKNGVSVSGPRSSARSLRVAPVSFAGAPCRSQISAHRRRIIPWIRGATVKLGIITDAIAAAAASMRSGSSSVSISNAIALHVRRLRALARARRGAV